MRLFFLDTVFGQTVREAASLPAARALGRCEFGSRGFSSARHAELVDLVSHKRAGGHIPEHYRAEVEAEERRLRESKSAVAQAKGAK